MWLTVKPRTSYATDVQFSIHCDSVLTADDKQRIINIVNDAIEEDPEMTLMYVDTEDEELIVQFNYSDDATQTNVYTVE